MVSVLRPPPAHVVDTLLSYLTKDQYQSVNPQSVGSDPHVCHSVTNYAGNVADVAC